MTESPKCYLKKDEFVKSRNNRQTTYLKENMWEAGSEIGTIDVKLFLTGEVNITAPRAVNFHA